MPNPRATTNPATNTRTGPRTGLTRLTLTLVGLGAAYVAVFDWAWPFLVAFLHWLEALSDTHGLSGFVFLALAPVGFLAACFGIDWIAAGFAGRPMAYKVAYKQAYKTAHKTAEPAPRP